MLRTPLTRSFPSGASRRSTLASKASNVAIKPPIAFSVTPSPRNLSKAFLLLRSAYDVSQYPSNMPPFVTPVRALSSSKHGPSSPLCALVMADAIWRGERIQRMLPSVGVRLWIWRFKRRSAASTCGCAAGSDARRDHSATQR